MNMWYRGFSLVLVIGGLLSGHVALAEGGPFTDTYFYKDKDGKEITCAPDATTEPCAHVVKLIKEREQSAGKYGDSQCFDDYRFNSVEADLAPEHDNAYAGVPMAFSGTITNRNPYPVFDATVYVKIFKTGNSGSVLIDQGDDVVDQFVALENIALPANGSKPIRFDYNLPRYIGAGTYRIATSVVLNDQFNMSGFPFLDDITGPTHSFTVGSDIMPVMWDKNAVTLNGVRHQFAKPSPVFGKDEDVVIAGTLRNPGTASRSVAVTASIYRWDSIKKDYLVSTASVGTYALEAGSTQLVTFEVPPVDHTVTYVVLEARDNDAKSLLDVRLAHEGIEWPRINFAGLTSYPLVPGREVSYMACIHNLGGKQIDNVTVEQTVTDAETGKKLASRTYTGPFSGAMGGIKASFVPDAVYPRVNLTTRTSYDGKVYDEAVVRYDCSMIGSASCGSSTGVSAAAALSPAKVALLVTTGILLLLIGGYLVRRRMAGRTLAILFFAVSVLSTASPVSAGAEDKGSTETFDVYINGGSDGHIWGSVFYHTWVSQKSGSTMPQGTDISLDTNWPNSDIEWFGVGAYVGGPGSPYGHWADDLDDVSDEYAVSVNSRDFRWNATAPTLVVHTYPRMTAEGSGAITCNNTVSPPVCMATGTGAGKITVKQDLGTLRVRQLYTSCAPPEDGGSCETIGVNHDSTMGVQVHEFDNYVVTASNQTPDAPSITGPGSFEEDSAQNFSLSATDPDSDTLRYGIDWDSNGSVDEYAPITGYVNSGTARTVTHTWVTPGAYTFKARTEDSKGGVSSWTAKTVTVTRAADPTVTMTGEAGKIAYEDRSFWKKMTAFWKSLILSAEASGLAVNIVSGQDVNLTWTSTNAVNCDLTLPFGTIYGVGTSRTDYPVSGLVVGAHTLTINCTGTNGNTARDQVNVVVAAPAPAALNICPVSTTVNEGGSTQLRAWYTGTGTSFNGCSAPNGTDRTTSSAWSSSNSGVASVSSGGLLSGVTPGSATIGASYSGTSDTMPATVLCTPKDSCTSQTSKDKAELVCTSDTFDISDGCGNTITCNGTRACDYNWKEVAP